MSFVQMRVGEQAVSIETHEERGERGALRLAWNVQLETAPGEFIRVRGYGVADLLQVRRSLVAVFDATLAELGLKP